MASTKPDFTLPDGREIFFDYRKITRKEWDSLKNPAHSDKLDYEILARVFGITTDELSDLDMFTFSRIFWELVNKMRTPLSDPT